MRYLAGQPIAGCPQIQAHVCAPDRVADRATDGSKGVLSKAKRCEERPEQRAIPKLGMVHESRSSSFLARLAIMCDERFACRDASDGIGSK